MISLWWSFALTAVGVLGLFLTYRSQSKAGPLVGIGIQTLWAGYAIVTGQWWFLVSAASYASVNTYGLIKRTKGHAPQ